MFQMVVSIGLVLGGSLPLFLMLLPPARQEHVPTPVAMFNILCDGSSYTMKLQVRVVVLNKTLGLRIEYNSLFYLCIYYSIYIYLLYRL